MAINPTTKNARPREREKITAEDAETAETAENALGVDPGTCPALKQPGKVLMN
jgi:hypothetical protein